jgi:hypothetical protein
MSSFKLKLAAITAMLLDHIGYVFSNDLQDWLYTALRLTGRLAMPVFCFLIAEGLFHTRSPLRYLLRLGTFAVISEIPYDLAIHGQVLEYGNQNVMFTLFLGLAAIAMFDFFIGAGRRGLALAAVLACGAAAVLLRTDYYVFGVYYVFAFYVSRKNTFLTAFTFSMGVFIYVLYNYLSSASPDFALMNLMAIGALALIFRYNGEIGGPAKAQDAGGAVKRKTLSARACQLAFYLFYPAHLFVLWAVRALLSGRVQ